MLPVSCQTLSRLLNPPSLSFLLCPKDNDVGEMRTSIATVRGGLCVCRRCERRHAEMPLRELQRVEPLSPSVGGACEYAGCHVQAMWFGKGERIELRPLIVDCELIKRQIILGGSDSFR